MGWKSDGLSFSSCSRILDQAGANGLKKKKNPKRHHAHAVIRMTGTNANCAFVFHSHQLNKHGLQLALHSPLIVFVVSGLGLLLIPCGAFGCSVITLNGFHTVATEFLCLCVCVFWIVHVCGCRRAYVSRMGAKVSFQKVPLLPQE